MNKISLFLFAYNNLHKFNKSGRVLARLQFFASSKDFIRITFSTLTTYVICILSRSKYTFTTYTNLHTDILTYT